MTIKAETKSTAGRSGLLRGLLAISVSALLLGFLFSRYEFSEVSATLRQGAGSGWIWLAVGLSLFLNVVVPSAKLRTILDSLGHRIAYRIILYLNFAADSVIKVLPFRSGEILRPWYLHRRCRVPLVTGVISVLVDLGFNMIGLFFIGLAGWLSLWLNSLTNGIILTAIAALGFMLLVGPAGKVILRVFQNKQVAEESIRYKIMAALGALTTIPRPRLALILLYALIDEFGEIIAVSLIFTAFAVDFELVHLMAYLPLIAFVSRLPISLSGLGVRESLFILAFQNSGGAAPAEWLGLGLIYSFIQILSPSIFGSPLTVHLLTTFPIKNKSQSL